MTAKLYHCSSIFMFSSWSWFKVSMHHLIQLFWWMEYVKTFPTSSSTFMTSRCPSSGVIDHCWQRQFSASLWILCRSSSGLTRIVASLPLALSSALNTNLRLNLNPSMMRWTWRYLMWDTKLLRVGKTWLLSHFPATTDTTHTHRSKLCSFGILRVEWSDPQSERRL